MRVPICKNIIHPLKSNFIKNLSGKMLIYNVKGNDQNIKCHKQYYCNYVENITYLEGGKSERQLILFLR